MRFLSMVFVLLTLTVTSIAQAGPCPTSNVIQDPATFQWTQQSGYLSGTLEFGQATLTFGADTLTTRAYRQAGGNYSIPGPTINMTPGQNYVLTLKNLLPYAAPSIEENTFKDPNITNLHTHGLHVSPMSPSDDVLRKINGAQCGDYVYEVPADHMGGTLWYHPHHHGATHLQVSGGAVGLLLINDSNDGIPANVAAMKERPLAIQFVDPAVAGTGGDTILSGTLPSTWVVNGKVQGNLCTPVNEWQHWRVLLAHSDAMERTLSVGTGCEVTLLARDGVWRTEAPALLPTNSIDLTGASRADLAVRCITDSSISVDNTVVAQIFADAALPRNLTVGPFSNGSSGTIWSAQRPSYLRDLRSVASVEQRNVGLGARTINSEKFDMHVPTFTIETGTVQEWDITAGAHPFHLHVYHFQMQSTCGAYEGGEYYDTINDRCITRFDLNPATSSVYDGATIMHCHILAHEDQGAMGWADIIVGGDGPPAGIPFQELYQCVTPTNCTFTVPSVTITPLSQTITTDGGSVTYSVSVKNNDTPLPGGTCQAFDYALSINDSNLTNFAPSTITPTTLNLSGGATGAATLTVKALRGQGGGTDVTTVTASAPAHLNGSASATTTIQIGQTVTVDQLQTGTVSGKGASAVFTPATTFTVGSDVNIRSHVVTAGIGVSNATVTQQIIAPNNTVVATLNSTTDANGYAIAKWRSRNMFKGTPYTVKVINVTNGLSWDGIIKTTTFTLN